MSGTDAVVLAQAEERLRQERELFDLKKAQDQRNFVLKLTMGWVIVVLLVAICGFAGYVIIEHEAYSASTVTVATSALLVEALGTVTAVFRGTLGKSPKDLEPTTSLSISGSRNQNE